MNDSQGPPFHYPSLQDSTTIEIFRPPPPTAVGSRGGTGPRFEYARRVRNFSRNESSRFQPPAYGADSRPPRYQDPLSGGGHPHRQSCPCQDDNDRHSHSLRPGHGHHFFRTFSHYHQLLQQHQARQLSQSSQVPPQATHVPPCDAVRGSCASTGSSGGRGGEEGMADIVDEEQRAFERRKTLKIRFAASLSIVLVVALVIAGTVGKISSMQKHGYYLGGDGSLKDGHETGTATKSATQTNTALTASHTRSIVVTSTPASSLMDRDWVHEEVSTEAGSSREAEATPDPTRVEKADGQTGVADEAPDASASDWEAAAPDEENRKWKRDLEGQTARNEWGDCG